MGQANARRKRESAFRSSLAARIDLERLAEAMRKLATAASEGLGADCALHAELPHAILNEAHVVARVAYGFAGWRIGNGDGDAIIHAPVTGTISHSLYGEAAFPYHAWLVLDHDDTPWILDFSTYQIAVKAAQLDAQDGGKTQVDWCPGYLLIPASQSRSLHQVMQGATGTCYYEENSSVTDLVEAVRRPLDQDDLSRLRFLYQHPDTCVFGTNDMRASL